VSSIVLSMSVCLSVCSHNLKTTQTNFTELHVRGSVWATRVMLQYLA